MTPTPVPTPGFAFDGGVLADVFTLLIAAGALVVSWLAYRYAKNAPARERLEKNRDNVRDAVGQVHGLLKELQQSLNRGHAVEQRPGALDAAAEKLEALGERVPEAAEIQEITAVLVPVRSGISDIDTRETIRRGAEHLLEQHQSKPAVFFQGADPEGAEGYKRKLKALEDDLHEAKNAESMAYASFQTALSKARKTSKAYLDKRDKEDREAVK